MPDLSDGGMRFDFSFKSGSGHETRAEPLRITILGDFGGSVTVGEQRSSGPHLVDCDNFDEVFMKIGVTLNLPPSVEGAPEFTLRFRKLEDFHPDQLLTQLDPLAKLIELRAKLLRPASSEEAAQELQEVLRIGALPAEPPPTTSTESAEELLSRLLGKPVSKQTTATSPAGLANRLIQQLVGTNVPGVHPQQPQLAALADAELSERLQGNSSRHRLSSTRGSLART